MPLFCALYVKEKIYYKRPALICFDCLVWFQPKTSVPTKSQKLITNFQDFHTQIYNNAFLCDFNRSTKKERFILRSSYLA